jgi:L-threonylcarbamoyladenylate synthase
MARGGALSSVATSVNLDRVVGMTDKKQILRVTSNNPLRKSIQEAATVLRRGGLVAFPTETVYGLGANALEKNAVLKIFEAKERPAWDPLIVHVPDTGFARSLARNLSPVFDELAHRFWPGPLTLVVEKDPCVPDEVTAKRHTIALRISRHKVPAMLLEELNVPIAAPSANKFGSPSPTRAEHVLRDLGDRVDLIVDGGPTILGVESTVLDLTRSTPVILRPGALSREDIEDAIGKVELAPGVIDEVAADGLAGPGMTLKHYAPRTRLELFDGQLHEIMASMVERAASLQQRNTAVGAIVSDEMIISMERHSDYLSSFGRWGEWLKYAQKLFAGLRALDSYGLVVILCPLPPAEGIGLAIRDRLLRAAGKTSP